MPVGSFGGLSKRQADNAITSLLISFFTYMYIYFHQPGSDQLFSNEGWKKIFVYPINFFFGILLVFLAKVIIQKNPGGIVTSKMDMGKIMILPIILFSSYFFIIGQDKYFVDEKILMGIDKNTNYVRDDLEKQINQNFEFDERLKNYALAYVQYMQKGMIDFSYIVSNFCKIKDFQDCYEHYDLRKYKIDNKNLLFKESPKMWFQYELYNTWPRTQYGYMKYENYYSDCDEDKKTKNPKRENRQKYCDELANYTPSEKQTMIDNEKNKNDRIAFENEENKRRLEDREIVNKRRIIEKYRLENSKFPYSPEEVNNFRYLIYEYKKILPLYLDHLISSQIIIKQVNYAHEIEDILKRSNTKYINFNEVKSLQGCFLSISNNSIDQKPQAALFKIWTKPNGDINFKKIIISEKDKKIIVDMSFSIKDSFTSNGDRANNNFLNDKYIIQLRHNTKIINPIVRMNLYNLEDKSLSAMTLVSKLSNCDAM